MKEARDIVLFLAGAEAFHTLAHMWLGMAVAWPMSLKLPRMTVTSAVNTGAIVINALITLALLWWAWRL